MPLLCPRFSDARHNHCQYNSIPIRITENIQLSHISSLIPFLFLYFSVFYRVPFFFLRFDSIRAVMACESSALRAQCSTYYAKPSSNSPLSRFSLLPLSPPVRILHQAVSPFSFSIKMSSNVFDLFAKPALLHRSVIKQKRYMH